MQNSGKQSSAHLDGEQLGDFQDELDEYDLLGNKGAAQRLTAADLSSTAKAFNTRIARKKREQEEADGQKEKVARARHGLMIKGLVSIRKSLRELTRINLGERFHFSYFADDHNGWPRLIVRLVDTELPTTEYPELCVTAHDRQEAGAIEIIYDGTRKPERISLAREGDFRRFPVLLRKCVRTYLDLVGDIVLEAERDPGREDDKFIESKALDEFKEGGDGRPQDMLSGDLFEEDFGGGNFLESLPSLDDVEALPSLAAGEAKPKN